MVIDVAQGAEICVFVGMVFASESKSCLIGCVLEEIPDHGLKFIAEVLDRVIWLGLNVIEDLERSDRKCSL